MTTSASGYAIEVADQEKKRKDKIEAKPNASPPPPPGPFLCDSPSTAT